MRVVVTGATGNVGTSVVEQLGLDDRVDMVAGVARRTPEWRPSKTEWAEVDVAVGDLEAVLAGSDAVVHLAWAFQPTHRPEVTWKVNVVGTSRLLDAVVSARVPVLVVASSVGAYSPADKAARVDESWPTHGWSPAAYCREKAYVERMLDRFEREHAWCRVVRMRPGFLFKRSAAPEQRRIFAGPFVSERLLGRVRLPIVPDLPGLVMQTMHTDDAASAYVRAVHADVSGAFNLAADPVVDASVLAQVFGGRPLRLPATPLRQALAAAWHARVVNASPYLFDYVLRMPLMDVTRARTDLGWAPEHSSVDALGEFRAGLDDGTGFPTPPLQPSAAR
jgi:nucleoside-diphosphate-sugar epimerase